MSGMLFIVSAPSGAGKTSLVNGLIGMLEDVVLSVSYTTRAPRPGERDGVEYQFVDEETFDGMISDGRFLEHATVFDQHYGTSRDWVARQRDAGLDVILEIDWQGARQVKNVVGDAVGVFILPPSLEELRARLSRRGQDSAEIIDRRMRDAVEEMSHYAEYDYLLVNDEFEGALAGLASIVRATRLSLASQRRRLAGTLAGLIPGADGA
ncbi:MAG: guanylate kinase [Gammaproteobacteria bacterium]|nr:guanylate kinase [Gammaproteobacteria bacterium]